MTISSTSNRKEYTGDGATVAFGTSPVVFFDEGDLTVYKVTTATGAATLQVLTTDYTVSGGSGSTGTVTMVVAPTAAQTLVIVRELDLVQEVDFVNNEATDAEVSEDALDKLTLMAQQLSAKQGRALALADSDVTGVSTTLPTPVAGKSFAWNAGLTALESVDSPANAVAAAAASAAAAAISETNAATSESNAATSESNAATSESNAAASAATVVGQTKSTVASATAPDIWTGTGHLIDYTGTATATSFAAAPQAGASRELLCAGASVFTNGANFVVAGGDFTATAGDRVLVVAETTTKFRLYPLKADGTAVAGGTAQIHACDFRLTLTTGTPVTTTDVTGATTIYCTPYKGNRIALYDGSNWNIRTSAEFSLAVGTLTSGLPYDVFCYDNSGTPTLEFTAWTNTTTRATALTKQDGVYVKTGATTRRYLGTFYTTATTTTEDSLAKRFLWNYYNRVARPMRGALETTDSWTYTTATLRQANANTANQLDMVIGVSEDAVKATAGCAAGNNAVESSAILQLGIGVDSTSANSATINVMNQNMAQSGVQQVFSNYEGFPGVGRHFLAWLEYSTATGTTTWRGDGGDAALWQSGIFGEIQG